MVVTNICSPHYEEEISGHRSSPMMVPCDPSAHFLFEPFSIAIAYMDFNIAGRMVVVNNPDLFSWNWPGDVE
jgi:hypothetical protein